MIRKGTIITPNYSCTDIVGGKRYVTVRDHEEYAVFVDDGGSLRTRGSFEVVGHIDDVGRTAHVSDITGNEVYVGDTIAYAFAGPAYRHLALFEVLQINGSTALCRSKTDGAVTTLGVFEDRAIKV